MQRSAAVRITRISATWKWKTLVVLDLTGLKTGKRLSEIDHFNPRKFLRIEGEVIVGYVRVRNEFGDCILIAITAFVEHGKALDDLILLFYEQLDLEVLRILLFRDQ